VSRRTILTALSLAAACVLALGLLPTAPRAADAKDDGVSLESMTFDAFKARLTGARSNNYKYTLVDAWATTCGPCKKNFPHLVAMNAKYAPKGLQVISLSLDDGTDAKALAEARQFLRDQKAKFLNVVLNEEFGVGFEKLEINAIPAVFVYDPDGKLVHRFTMDDPNNQFTYDEVEKAVASLLDGKAK